MAKSCLSAVPLVIFGVVEPALLYVPTHPYTHSHPPTNPHPTTQSQELTLAAACGRTSRRSATSRRTTARKRRTSRWRRARRCRRRAWCCCTSWSTCTCCWRRSAWCAAGRRTRRWRGGTWWPWRSPTTATSGPATAASAPSSSGTRAAGTIVRDVTPPFHPLAFLWLGSGVETLPNRKLVGDCYS